MIRNYIFDFGNVLARFYPEELTRASVKKEENVKLIAEVVFDRLYWDRLDDGTISDEEVKAGIKSRLPEDLREEAINAYEGWIDNLVPINGMRELIADIKKRGAKLYLLSNISIGFAENYHKTEWIRELFSLFDGLVFSGPIGIVKPQPEIFEHLLNKYSLNREECIFIDDSEKNMIGAEKVGIKTYLFDGDVEKLKKMINNA